MHSNTESLTQRIGTILPDFIRDEAPVFESFLSAYTEYLESEIITLESQEEIDTLLLEDGVSSMLLETSTVSPSPDQDSSKIAFESTVANANETASPFTKGEYVIGSVSKCVAKIDVINGNKLYISTVLGEGFSKGEKITGRESKQTGVVSTYKHNAISANNRLLQSSDVDTTSEEFLQYFQNDFIPSLDIGSTVNKRLTIKNIKDLYQNKGTADSIKFLMRLLYGQDAEVRYPNDETIYVSESDYNEVRRVRVQVSSGPPSATDRIIQFRPGSTTTIDAEAVVENVFVDSLEEKRYSLEITENHIGTFTQGSEVTFIDRDGLTEYTGTIIGVISGVTDRSSSTYVEHDDDGVILFENSFLTGTTTLTTDSTTLVGSQSKFTSEVSAGDILTYVVSDTTYTVTVDKVIDDETITLTANPSVALEGENVLQSANAGGGLLYESSSLGSLYSLNDNINFSGSKEDVTNNSTEECRTRVDGLSKGGITHIYVESAGQNYEAGDLIVFDNDGTQGGGAEAVIGAVGDEALLEAQTQFGHYEFDGVNGQSLYGGPGVRDKFGQLIIFNDQDLDVYVDGVLQTRSTSYTTNDYTSQNDRVTFTNAMSGGERIEFFTAYNRLVYENNDPIALETTVGDIRSVKILNSGGGYTQVPKINPGGYLYLSDVSGFQVDEVIEGQNSSATATIIRIESDKKRLVVKRLDTDTGAFQQTETIVGQTSNTSRALVQANVSSGTGGTLFAYSDDIGGVKSVNIINQGSKFTMDGVVSNDSYFPMLITTPTATPFKGLTITGEISGTTAEVVRYDADRHIMTYTNLDGCFLKNENVKFNTSDNFNILQTSAYNARGQFGGEGKMQEQFITDKGQLNAQSAHMQDGLYYQTHSYVVKVGESINKYRSVLKDLIHPAGHVFFGEVGIQNSINTVVENQISSLHTVVFVMEPVLYVPDAFSNSWRTAILHADMTADGPEGGFALTRLEEAGQPTYNTDPRTGGAITEIATEYGDSSVRNRHVNITKIQSYDQSVSLTPIARGESRINGSLNLTDNQIVLDHHRRTFINSYGEEVSPVQADQGKIDYHYTPVDERLILEDGGQILIEDEVCLLRAEPQIGAIVKGVFGDNMIYEDGTYMRMESETTIEETFYFITERSIETDDKYVLFENGDRLITEDGDEIIDEHSTPHSNVSYAPLGSTLRSLNIIQNQNTYDIAYYLKQDDGSASNSGTHGDDIVLEDGYGSILSEESVPEGLRLYDLDDMYPRRYIPSFATHERERTNFAFSSYIKSA